MPNVFDPNNEENENQDQLNQDNGQISNPSTGGGESSTITGAAPSSSTTPKSGGFANKAPTTSGRFVNIQNYINANRQGAQGLAQGVNQKIGSSVNQAKADIGSSQQQSAKELGTLQSGVQSNQKAGQQAIGNLYNPNPNMQQDITAAPKKQADMTNINDQSSKIQQGLNKDYQDQLKNSQLANYQGLLGQGQSLRETGEQVTTEGGKQALLQKLYSQPTYNRGQSNLDTMLIGSSKENQNLLNQARQQTRAFSPVLQQAVQQYGQQRDLTQQTLDKGADAVQERLGSRAQELTGMLDQDAAAYNAALQQQANNLDPRIALKALQDQGYEIDSTDPNNPGVLVSDGSGFKTKLGLSDLINSGSLSGQFQQAQSTNVDPEKLARTNALRKLAGLSELTQGAELNNGVNANVDRQKASETATRVQKQRDQQTVDALMKKYQQTKTQYGNGLSSDEVKELNDATRRLGIVSPY